ncbi:MAG: chloride channel protein [Gammaproteobacteria bacterium]
MEKQKAGVPIRLWPLIPMAITVGVLAALFVLGFRRVIETSQRLFLPYGIVGNYEALTMPLRFAIPVLGGIVLAFLFSRIPRERWHVGIVYVMSRLNTPGGISLPLSQAIFQFFAGVLAIVSGHSVDREGPSVHLGAAMGNAFARLCKINPAEIHLLTMTGVAAGMAAALNTPLTGVVFVLEVMGETLAPRKLLAVLTGSVTAAVLGRLAYGAEPAFAVPALDLAAGEEFLWIILLGMVIGLLAAAAINSVERVSRYMQGKSPWLIFTLAGLCTATLGLFSPHILGVSYDTVGALLQGHVLETALASLVVFKLMATIICIGCGVPGGLIGPSLVIGGAAGGLAGKMIAGISVHSVGSVGFYAMTGMCAMLGVMLAAPLTAVTALFELTGDLHLILAGMLALIAADSICWSMLGTASVFQHMLAVMPGSQRGQDHGADARDRK